MPGAAVGAGFFVDSYNLLDSIKAGWIVQPVIVQDFSDVFQSLTGAVLHQLRQEGLFFLVAGRDSGPKFFRKIVQH